ncbi:DNA adenine methylase [Thermoactinomyces sp. CICC 23799]|uniref:DNA adenine methylase n=1 Tax=Thermoactinomyces sp. CICC 23799 TaxID=2767429 RepID=UPI0018DC8B9F|nr:DNA adenine methylase [Thermoactinomyces sp. CICC 23799]MBH8602055.1 DNA adenine methylase [Thermoactinomyces sp. CICC 23799]
MISNKIRSPLRFPGSKSKVLNRFYPYFYIPHIEYREPFFGGGAIFFGKPKAKINWINDKDYSVYAFFKIVRDYPDDICKFVLSIKPSIEIWKEIRSIKPQNELEVAYKFLFLNRTNYSGIITANPIGGIKQKSNWKIDCRWNPEMLCKRIKECSSKLQNVKITCLDFEELILAPGKDVFLVLDPPYYKKGHELYPVSMSHEEHVKLARLLKKTQHNFLLTIDDCEEVKEIYQSVDFYVNQESWCYSINQGNNTKIGRELFISNIDISKYMQITIF